MLSRDQISACIKEAAQAAGFDLSGVAPVQEEDLPELGAFIEWIDAGHAGEMRYLEKRTDSGALARASVRNSAPWVRSVVMCALNYNTDHPYSTELNDRARGWISRYAWGNADYHETIMPRLRSVEAALQELAARHQMEVQTRSYVDTGPLMERVYAKHAGLGWIGKNTCLIHPKMGSWLFLGAVLTSLELPPDLPAPDRCGSCTRCIDACPTAAIIAPGKLDARRCIAYLTIEKRGDTPEDLRDAVGHHVFGCDICQDVCPWNTKSGNAPPTSLPEFQPREGLFHPELRRLASMDQHEFRGTFRGSAVKRAKYNGLMRNVAVAMGNSGDPAFAPELKQLANDGDATLAEHARWALKKLGIDH